MTDDEVRAAAELRTHTPDAAFPVNRIARRLPPDCERLLDAIEFYSLPIPAENTDVDPRLWPTERNEFGDDDGLNAARGIGWCLLIAVVGLVLVGVWAACR